MSALATTSVRESSTVPAPASSHPTDSLARVASLARQRATSLPTTIPTPDLVQLVLARYDDAYGAAPGPVDLDGWVRRTIRELVSIHQHQRRRRSGDLATDQTRLVEVLAGLTRPVRAPSLAKQRKLLLRRVNELIGGPESRVVFAMIAESSLDAVADQLGLSPLDVARMHRRGLHQLQSWLEHDHELAARMHEASRQPKRARTSPAKR